MTTKSKANKKLVMKKFIGLKEINAAPMDRLAYNNFRGWALPSDENGSDKGMLVEYIDGGAANTKELKGYVSWSPMDVFDNAYKPVDNMDFSSALFLMKQGYKVARAGWNGKGMWIIRVPGTKVATLVPGTPYAKALPKRKTVEILPHFDMYTTNAKGRRAMLPGWLASQSDMDANDWMVVK